MSQLPPSQLPLSQLPPPGWYPDPSSARIYRWWDGQAWTKHTSVGQPVATEVPAAAVTAPVHATVGSATTFAEAQFPAPAASFPSPARPSQQPNIGQSIWQRNR